MSPITPTRKAPPSDAQIAADIAEAEGRLQTNGDGRTFAPDFRAAEKRFAAERRKKDQARGVDAFGVPVNPAPEPPDEADLPSDEVAAVVRDASERLLALRVQRRHVAPEALGGDSRALEELRGIDGEIQAAESVIALEPEARAEVERREQEAQQQAAERDRASAQQDSERLHKIELGQAGEVDKALKALAATLHTFTETRAKRHQAQVAAGERPYGSAWSPAGEITGAYWFAMEAEGTEPTLINPRVNVRACTLADAVKGN